MREAGRRERTRIKMFSVPSASLALSLVRVKLIIEYGGGPRVSEKGKVDFECAKFGVFHHLLQPCLVFSSVSPSSYISPSEKKHLCLFSHFCSHINTHRLGSFSANFTLCGCIICQAEFSIHRQFN